MLRSYAYDSNPTSKHQLVSMKDRFGSSTAFTYDTRGNQVSRSGATQNFDELDRPTTLVNDAGQTVTLTWHRDERKLKTFQIGAGEVRTLKYDSDGRVVKMATASWMTEYAYDAGGLASFKTGGAWYYLDRSTRGDITGIRDAAAVLQATIRHTAYGEQWTDNQTLVDKLALTYNGRDGVVSLGGGLYWMQHRVYQAVQARFLSVDPVEAGIGSTQSAYNYGDNDPINHVDPSGTYAVVLSRYAVAGGFMVVTWALGCEWHWWGCKPRWFQQSRRYESVGPVGGSSGAGGIVRRVYIGNGLCRAYDRYGNKVYDYPAKRSYSGQRYC